MSSTWFILSRQIESDVIDLDKYVGELDVPAEVKEKIKHLRKLAYDNCEEAQKSGYSFY